MTLNFSLYFPVSQVKLVFDVNFEKFLLLKTIQIYGKARREFEATNEKDRRNSEFRHDHTVCRLRIAETNLKNKTKAGKTPILRFRF